MARRSIRLVMSPQARHAVICRCFPWSRTNTGSYGCHFPRCKNAARLISQIFSHGKFARCRNHAWSLLRAAALLFLHLLDEVVVFGDDIIPVFYCVIEFFYEFIALDDEIGDGL